MKVRQFIRRQVRRLVPKPLRDRAKAVIGSLGSVLQVVNATVPEWSDEAKAGVGVVLVIATFLGIYEVENERRR